MDTYRKANLDWWNEVVGVHALGDTYGLESFKAGLSKLTSLELEEVGEVAGKSLLHLQCHFGLDSLAWARLGASVTGVDFSEKAIALAKSLGSETALNATFVQSDLYELPNVLSGTFDIVYTSYGVLEWLPDLLPWGHLIAHYLKPGGFFYIVEGHPFLGVFDAQSSDFKVVTSYFTRDPIKEEQAGSYANRGAKMEHTLTYGWNHTFSEIFTALLSAGLGIEFLHEFPFCRWEHFPGMVRGQDRFYRLQAPEFATMIPMTFSLKATKPV